MGFTQFGLNRVENRVLIIISDEFCCLTDHFSDNQLTDHACDSSLAVCYVRTLSSSAYQLRIRSGFDDLQHHALELSFFPEVL